MKIIACLGNPGRKYKKHRHNAGFIIGEYLAKEFGIKPKKKSFNSHYGTGKIEGKDILLLFPETFMNNSGTAVHSSLQYYNATKDDLIVIHDEIELPFGDFKIKYGGGHKGHNGIRSIMKVIGTPDFNRLRIGVGRPEEIGRDVARYVLSNFSREELKGLEYNIQKIIETIKETIK